MTPFNENRKSYITVCFATAVIYAFVAGVNQPVFFRLLDGIIYGVILFPTGLAVWNIFRFAIPVNYPFKYRIFSLSVFAIATSAFVTGIETLAIYLCFPSTFDVFVSTIPVRAFIAFLFFIILYLSHFFFHESIEENEHFLEESPMDSSLTDLPSSSTALSEKAETAAGLSPLSAIASVPSSLRNIDRMTVRSGQKIKIIPIGDILYIKADGDYISIRTAEGSWLKEQTMKYTEDRLPIADFVRIHRSYIVNIRQIIRIERYGEKQLIVLNNNEKIKISAARYRTLKQILGI